MITRTNPASTDLAASPRSILARVALSCFCVCCLIFPGRARGGETDLGFLFFHGDDIESNDLTTAVGPVYELRRSISGMRLRAIRPLYSAFNEEAKDRQLQEVLWPVGMVKDFHGERTWRFLLAYGNDFDSTDPDSRYRFIVFPVLFAGRDANEQGYFAIFPLGGRINEFLGQDTMSFVLFPLYGSSRINDVKAHTVLWPIVAWASGGGMRKFRVFPFYGESEKREQWFKRFVLWPIWTSVRYDYPDQPGGGFVFFPFYGHVKAGDNNESWMFVPPLFRFSKSSKQVEVNAPWPIIQYASGEYEKMYFWPVWGKKAIGPVRSWFCIWPLVSGETHEKGSYTTKRFLLLPFIQHEVRLVKTDNDREDLDDSSTSPPSVDYRYLKLWPLLDYSRQGEDRQFRMLALWPFSNARSMDRNYRPFWTLYSHLSAGHEREDTLLWGLFRWRRSDTGNRDVTLFPLFSERKTCEYKRSREWRFLLGLAGYRREGARKTYRLLYFIKWQTGADDAEP